MKVANKETTITWTVWDGHKEYMIKRVSSYNDAPVSTYHVYESPYGWRQLLSGRDAARNALEALEATLI